VIGAGGAGFSTPGPVPTVSDVRAPAADSTPQDASSSGSRFADALDSARDTTDSRVQTSGIEATPVRVDTAARARTAPADTVARSGAQSDATQAGGGQPTVRSGAAQSAPVAGSTPQLDIDADAVAALLSALVIGPQTKGSGTSSSDTVARASDDVAKSDQSGATVSDPVGLLAMILGVVPAAAATAAGGGGAATASAALPGASFGGGAGSAAALTGASALAVAADAGAADAVAASTFAASQISGTETSTAALVAQLAALPDGTAPRSDGADTRGPAAPSAQALSDLMHNFAPSAAPASSVQQNIAPVLGSADWPGAVAAQVHWLASSGVSSATLTLSPEHLGPIQVYIDQQSSQVNVSFNAAHADTRAALEQALPKLREMFAAGGLALGQATVQQEARSGSQSAAPAAVTRVSESADAASAQPVSQALGLVDEYA
jgi:flagellar hook-length control protein FliK